jgi:hypothetical protein
VYFTMSLLLGGVLKLGTPKAIFLVMVPPYMTWDGPRKNPS